MLLCVVLRFYLKLWVFMKKFLAFVIITSFAVASSCSEAPERPVAPGPPGLSVCTDFVLSSPGSGSPDAPRSGDQVLAHNPCGFFHRVRGGVEPRSMAMDHSGFGNRKRSRTMDPEELEAWTKAGEAAWARKQAEALERAAEDFQARLRASGVDPAAMVFSMGTFDKK